MSNQNAIAQQDLSQSQRFMNKVVSEFSSSVGMIALTNFQQRLAQNYFIGIDAVLKTTEEKRMAKSEKYRDALPATWANVNMEKLARDVVTYARIGFDPAQKNHINMIPFKNNKTNKYDIVFIEGYRGLELKAVKYGLDVPDEVTVEVVYSTDKFRPIKKDQKNKYEGYEFEITNPFERGNIIGGFYYHLYTRTPEKNKLVVMSMKDILKRKPDHASPEFWGGEKDKWENGQKVGKEQVEGWYEKMVWKTIYRAAHSDVTIDSQKIDDDYLRLKQMEAEYSDSELAREIAENANQEPIDIEAHPPKEEPSSHNPKESSDELHASTNSPSEQPVMDFGDEGSKQTAGAAAGGPDTW
jgi:recombination protein RecT